MAAKASLARRSISSGATSSMRCPERPAMAERVLDGCSGYPRTGCPAASSRWHLRLQPAGTGCPRLLRRTDSALPGCRPASWLNHMPGNSSANISLAPPMFNSACITFPSGVLCTPTISRPKGFLVEVQSFGTVTDDQVGHDRRAFQLSCHVLPLSQECPADGRAVWIDNPSIMQQPRVEFPAK